MCSVLFCNLSHNPGEALLSLSKAGSAVKLHLAVDMAIFEYDSS